MSEPRLRRYRVPGGELDCGGMIVIGDDGYFSAVTDFGNYAYGWWSYGLEGSDFRSALCKFSPDYICGKLGLPVYDQAKTLAGIKRHLTDEEESGTYSREFVESEQDLLSGLDDGEYGFWRWFDATEIEDAVELRETSPAPDLVSFATHTWPRFVATLRAEMDAERRIEEHARGTR